MGISKKLEDHLIAFLADHTAGSGEKRLLAGISGGGDSSALLRLLVSTKGRHGLDLTAGHVNHRLRPDADAEEERLRSWCAGLSVPFHCIRLEWNGMTPSEAAQRRARHMALGRMARAAGCGWVALAHQVEDQAETILMKLFRGTGMAGLAGMAPRRGRILRPLLAIPRSMLRDYLTEIGESWVDDPTNRDLSKTRNRIRHEIIPLLDSVLRPGTAGRVARAGLHARSAMEALDEIAERFLRVARLPAASRDELRLDAALLRTGGEGLILRAVRLALDEVLGSTQDVPEAVQRAITEAIVAGGEGRWAFARRAVMEVTGRSVWMARSGEWPASATRARVLPLDRRTRSSWGKGAFILSSTRRVKAGVRITLRGLDRAQAFDLARIRGPVSLRIPRSGDTLPLEESRGSRTLADLLSERGVPRSLRIRQPVIEDQEGILWVPGIRRSPRALVGEETTDLWILRWRGGLPVDHALWGGLSRE